jgi:hypothetical protein
MYIQYLGEIVGVCNQVNFLILYYKSARFVPLLEVINAPIQVPDIVDLTANFKFLNFSLQICLRFVPETSSSTTSYIVLNKLNEKCITLVSLC